MQTLDRQASSTEWGTGARRLLNLALFPVSAGAVVAEAGYALEALLSISRHLGLWGGLVGIAAAVILQLFSRSRI